MTDKELIKAALKYKSGADSCNSVYMGSMATARACAILGVGWPPSVKLADAVDNASDKVIERLLEHCQHYIDYMLEHPTTRCKSCGQIIPTTN